MKTQVLSFFRLWLDLVFPPLCASCHESCRTLFFCPGCWELCSLIDPASRCRHCFEEMEEEICLRCRNRASLPFPSAFVFEATPPALRLSCDQENPTSLAAFAVVQWERLDWPLPDFVVPHPEDVSLARAFAEMLERPFAKVLVKTKRGWRCDAEALEEESHLLLFSSRTTREEAGGAIDALLEAFPKKIFVLSLTPFIERSHDLDPPDPSLLGPAGSGSLHGSAYRPSATGVDRAAPRKIQPAPRAGAQLDRPIY